MFGREKERTENRVVRPDAGKRSSGQSWFQIMTSLLGGVLLALSFPGYDRVELAFIGLIPLFYAVHAAAPRRAALLGWLCGTAFFLTSLSWLQHLTNTVEGFIFQLGCIVGYVLLSMLCALYFIPVAIASSVCVRRWGIMNLRKNLLTMLCITTVWVGSEYLRSTLFTGFSWNLLGTSQYQNLSLVQVANWGGVYAVSMLIVWFNAAAFITFMQYTHGSRAKKYRPHVELMAGIVLVAISLAYGFRLLLGRSEPTEPPVRVALIQPNISQSEKWDQRHVDEIYTRLDELTDAAMQWNRADLVIWPETALPESVQCGEDVPFSEASATLVRRVLKGGSPLLAGAMTVDRSVEPYHYFNSSILIDEDGVIVEKYDKQHLVPFGEYIPLPMIRKYTPITDDLTAGTESTLFQAPGDIPVFSTLICFEDIVAPLSVKAVRGGARWLINQTNDGWFDPGSQSEQHVAQAVFRCIENRVPMARCGNTGTSCVIDAYGGITRSLAPQTEGFDVLEVYPAPDGQPLTLYSQFGDLFARANVIVASLFFVGLYFTKKKQTAKNVDQPKPPEGGTTYLRDGSDRSNEGGGEGM